MRRWKMTTDKKYPPISPGTRVKTTQEDSATANSWTKDAQKRRRWGAEGAVITHHDSHGLCYEIRHDDGTVGCYDPSEFDIIAPS